MNWHLYWRALYLEHAQTLSETAPADPPDPRPFLWLALTCALVTAIAFAAGGYRAGFETVYGMGRPLPVYLIEILSKLGETLVAICLVALVVRRKPRLVWMALLASGYAALLTESLKHLCHTARPPAVLGDWVVVSGPVLKMFSFPSGHTVTAFLLAWCFSVGAPKRIRLVLFSIAAAVGTSRVWMGVHWPVDVVAGMGVAGLSIALALITVRLTRREPGLAPHLCFVMLIVLCAVYESMTGPPDVLARLLRIEIAGIALIAVARDYVLRPLLFGRVGAARTAPVPRRT